MTRHEFADLMQTIADAWNRGDARRAADCFAEDAVYSEPPTRQLYRGREELYAFFGGGADEPPAMRMDWHHLVFDEATQIGAGEYTFEGRRRYHGAVLVRIAGGLVANSREYQYQSDLDWPDFVGDNRF